MFALPPLPTAAVWWRPSAGIPIQLTQEKQTPLNPEGPGRRVRSIRRSLDWTQEQLAKATGIDRTIISRLEHGQVPMFNGYRCRIASALGVNESDLI